MAKKYIMISIIQNMPIYLRMIYINYQRKNNNNDLHLRIILGKLINFQLDKKRM